MEGRLVRQSGDGARAHAAVEQGAASKRCQRGPDAGLCGLVLLRLSEGGGGEMLCRAGHAAVGTHQVAPCWWSMQREGGLGRACGRHRAAASRDGLRSFDGSGEPRALQRQVVQWQVLARGTAGKQMAADAFFR
jgi:hypothetical protein